MGVFFAIHGHQHIGAGNRVAVRVARRHMHDGALYYALKTQCWLGVDFVFAWENRRAFIDEFTHVLAQDVDIGRAGAQDVGGGSVIEIGRASCRERVWPSVLILGVGVSLENKKKN